MKKISNWKAYTLTNSNAIRGGSNPWLDNPEYDPWLEDESNGNG